jgi:hypothetical protein
MSKAAAKGTDAPKKGKKGSAKGPGGARAMSVATHPRASAQIRRMKGWGGLIAFGLTAYLSLSHGAPIDVAGERALVAGIAGMVLARACGVMVWRHLMLAELRARVERARRPAEGPPPTPPVPAAEQPAPAQS